MSARKGPGALLKARELSSFSFVALLFLLVGLVNPGFLAPENLLLTVNASVVFTLLAAGSAFVIITGEIDVSIGAIMGLCAAVSASLIRDGAPWPAAIASALALGLLCGILNGAGLMFLRIPSIIMTLGSSGIIRGLIYVYTGGKWVENVPFDYKALSQANFLGVSLFYWGALAVMIAGTVIMKASAPGRCFAAVGDNISCAVFLGLPVRATKIAAFALSGLFAAVAGLLFVSRIGFVTPMAGNGYEMKAIAACVLGGVSLTGGVGSLLGASMGAIIMASIGRILVFLNSSADDNTITGTMLIIIIVADALIQQRMAERARRKRLEAKLLAALPGDRLPGSLPEGRAGEGERA
ncbi:MAG: ABC transporter permease [Spirochaetaceae bacterium]|jgi:AI-2 transport system permease protein|nr:ABC transporter permease [Spirochaetaceae bacterium]